MVGRFGFLMTDARSPTGQFPWLAMVLGVLTVATICTQVLVLSISAVAWRRGDAVREIPAFGAAKAIVESAEHVELWRGLPRYGPPSESMAYVERFFGLFEVVPVEPNSEDAMWLRTMCGGEQQFSLRDEEAYSLCGGYHADWSVVFAGPKGTAEFGLCFGCGEVKILAGETAVVHLDLQRGDIWANQLHHYSAK